MSNGGLEILVQVDAPWGGIVDEAALRNLAGRVLTSENVALPVEVGVVITDDDTVRGLNRRYLDRDEPTDVLSFPLADASAPKDVGEPFIGPPGAVAHLGDVIVSYPAAERQAREQGHGVEREIDHLVVHGLLHLLGYDHEESEEEERMRSLEDRLLAASGHLGEVKHGPAEAPPRRS